MEIKDLVHLTIEDLARRYRDGRADPVAVMEATLEQITRVNADINAIYDLQAEASLTAAKAAAQRFRKGENPGAMAGMPVSIKDSVHAVGMVWHHGARLHGKGVTGTKDAPPAEKLKAADAIIIGKGTMPDFGLSGSGVSSYHGIVRNPWGLEWNTGGSSAGAGASVAAGIGMLSVGSDIAGSVRLPASHCGLAALKPTQGMIPHTPASDIRSAGPITRYAADLEFTLRILGGLHDDDRFSLPVVDAEGGFEAANVAVYTDFGFGPEVEDAVLCVLDRAAAALGPLVGSISEGGNVYDFDAYIPIDDSLKLRGWREYAGAKEELRAEAPSSLFEWFREARDWDATRVAEFEAGLARGVAQTGRLFGDADFLLTPVMPCVNFPATELGPVPSMPLRHTTFTAPFNQSGHPAVTLCGGFDAQGLPVGVQLVGKRCDDVRLCRLAAALEVAIWGGDVSNRDWPVEPRAIPRIAVTKGIHESEKQTPEAQTHSA